MNYVHSHISVDTHLDKHNNLELQSMKRKWILISGSHDKNN